jgi:hypothetical protein
MERRFWREEVQWRAQLRLMGEPECRLVTWVSRTVANAAAGVAAGPQAQQDSGAMR